MSDDPNNLGATPEFVYKLMTSEFEDLDEADRQFMMGRASLAFENFPEGVVMHEDGSVTIDKYVQAKITYNALSHKQQVTFIGSLLSTLFSTVINTVDEPAPELQRILAFIASTVSVEFIKSNSMGHDPDDEIN